jgi:GNAT superfamily N-acetyltransferase
MIVRPMLPHELDATMILMNYYRDELFEKHPSLLDEYDENSITETVRRYVINHEFVWFNAYEGQRPVGFIGGHMSNLPWNNSIISANIDYIYMCPGKQTNANYKQLMESFEEWARAIKATKITGSDFNCTLEEGQEFFKSFGYTPVVLSIKELT